MKERTLFRKENAKQSAALSPLRARFESMVANGTATEFDRKRIAHIETAYNDANELVSAYGRFFAEKAGTSVVRADQQIVKEAA